MANSGMDSNNVPPNDTQRPFSPTSTNPTQRTMNGMANAQRPFSPPPTGFVPSIRPLNQSILPTQSTVKNPQILRPNQPTMRPTGSTAKSVSGSQGVLAPEIKGLSMQNAPLALGDQNIPAVGMGLNGTRSGMEQTSMRNGNEQNVRGTNEQKGIDQTGMRPSMQSGNHQNVIGTNEQKSIDQTGMRPSMQSGNDQIVRGTNEQKSIDQTGMRPSMQSGNHQNVRGTNEQKGIDQTGMIPSMQSGNHQNVIGTNEQKSIDQTGMRPSMQSGNDQNVRGTNEQNGNHPQQPQGNHLVPGNQVSGNPQQPIQSKTFQPFKKSTAPIVNPNYIHAQNTQMSPRPVQTQHYPATQGYPHQPQLNPQPTQNFPPQVQTQLKQNYPPQPTQNLPPQVQTQPHVQNFAPQNQTPLSPTQDYTSPQELNARGSRSKRVYSEQSPSQQFPAQAASVAPPFNRYEPNASGFPVQASQMPVNAGNVGYQGQQSYQQPGKTFQQPGGNQPYHQPGISNQNPPAYPQQPEMNNQPAYPQQPGMNQPVYPPQQGMNQPVYPPQQGMNNQPAYPQQPGMNNQSGYPQQPGMQSGFPQQPGLQNPKQRIDPDQIPSVVAEREKDQQTYSSVAFPTSSRSVPPFSTTNFRAIDEGSCNPRFIRSTMYNIPTTDAILKQSSIPFGIIVQPLADLNPDETPIEVIDFGKSGPVRCTRCLAYVNPNFQFLNGGRLFICNLCSFSNTGN
jgi:protein transport protein SEC24